LTDPLQMKTSRSPWARSVHHLATVDCAPPLVVWVFFANFCMAPV